MMVTGTRRRRHNQRQQHQECREPEHRPEHPFRRFFDHGALTPEAIEIVGSLLKMFASCKSSLHSVRKRHRLAISRRLMAISRSWLSGWIGGGHPAGMI
jgi:hypothetical protein